jgi:TP901 family phage tail tape measure protein
MSAGAVRAGKAFIEISANDDKFTTTLKKTQHSIVRLSGTLKRAGTGMAIGGAAMGLPMLLAAQSAATFQDSLLELKGATADLSDEGLARVRAEALRLSRTMGISATKIAQSFTLLIKAGMTVEEALGGAGKSAVEFAQVSGVEAAQAAEFMKVAMNVFGGSAEDAANTLSAAADSSETSIAAMIESFALVASVAKGTNQSLFGLSQGIAILARYGIKGEEAGTGIKTLLVKLLAPTKEATEALATLGISMESLVDQQGKLLPISQIAEIFAQSMRGMDKSARDAMLTNKALVDVFDVRGIRVIHAFAEQGIKGFDAMARSMSMSRTVAEKFKIAMSQLTGVGESLKAVVERLAIAFADGGFTKAVRRAADAAIFLIDTNSLLISSVPGLTVVMAGLTGGLFAVGVAVLGVGVLLQAVNFALAGYITYTATATGLTTSWSVAIVGLSAAFGKLRLAMFAIPGIGWIAGAVAAIGGLDALQKLSAWEQESNAMEASNRRPIGRSERRTPLGRAGSVMAGGGSGMGSGETLGTFFGGVASRLAIGPALSVAEETAANTARTADGVAELVAAGRVVPNAAGLRAGIAGGGPVAAAGVAATSDRDLISAAERTAMATEQSNSLLRRMAESYHAGVAFQ